MGLSRDDAFAILGLQSGASKDEIRSSYKKLALQWHPDKHDNPEVATKKFQDISCAYKKLTTEEDSTHDITMTEFDMFELFKMMFFNRGGAFFFEEYTGSPLDVDDDYGDDDYSDDHDFLETDDEDYGIDGGDMEASAHRLHSKYCMQHDDRYGWFMPKHQTEEEARRNADELLQQEEDEKRDAQRKEEKRKAKNKRKKEAKKKKNKKGQESSEIGAAAKPPATSTSKGSSTQKGSVVPEISKQKSEEDEDCVENEETRHEDDCLEMEDDDEGDWDLASAFVRGRAKKAAHAAKAKAANLATAGEKPRENMTASVGQATAASTNGVNASEEESTVSQARYFAMRGNEMAQRGHYQAAVDLFAEAIQLHATDQRYFGNRSFCYDCLLQHRNALDDAETAIKLAPEWPKGYFRRGRALCGLKRWKDAEESFDFVLALDPSCSDAQTQLRVVRAHQLQEMGFTLEQAALALNEYKTVPAALDALLSGAIVEQSLYDDETYISDEDDFDDTSAAPLQPEQLHLPNPETGVVSLWVGNINSSQVGKKELEQLFSQCGLLSSVRAFPGKKYAFVNFADARAAATAMQTLQGYFIGGLNLVIRYPNNAASTASPTDSSGSGWAGEVSTMNGIASQQRNGFSTGQAGRGAYSGATAGHSGRGGKVHGLPSKPHKLGAAARAARKKDAVFSHTAVDTSNSEPSECVYWRAKGCVYGKKCRNLHIPENKGVDAASSSRKRR